MPAQINLARVAAMQGKPSDAEQMLSGILDKNPDSEPALTMLVSQYAQTNRMPDAIALLEKARKANRHNTRLMTSLGRIYIPIGKPAEALALVNKEKGADSEPGSALLKAAAFMALDQKDQARDTYSQILKVDPTIHRARRALEALLVQAGDYEHARNLIKEGLVSSPRNYQLYQDYVMVDLKASGVDAASATAKQLIEQDRDFQPARALIGDVYEAANRPADAVQAYQEALTRHRHRCCKHAHGGVFARTGQGEAAAIRRRMIGSISIQMILLVSEQFAELEIVSKKYDDAVKHLTCSIKKAA